LEYNKRIIKKQQSMQGIQKLIIDGTQVTNQPIIANALNTYFSSSNNYESNRDKPDNVECDKLPTYSNLKQGKETPAPPLVFKSFSTKE